MIFLDLLFNLFNGNTIQSCRKRGKVHQGTSNISDTMCISGKNKMWIAKYSQQVLGEACSTTHDISIYHYVNTVVHLNQRQSNYKLKFVSAKIVASINYIQLDDLTEDVQGCGYTTNITFFCVCRLSSTINCNLFSPRYQWTYERPKIYLVYHIVYYFYWRTV